MRHYLIEPTYKKSVVEYELFKHDDGRILTREVGWRWGSFIIHVPETEDELKEWANTKGFGTISDARDGYGLESNEPFPPETFLPNESWDFIELDDYDYEMVEMWDGCWEDWAINSEEDTSELEEELSEAYFENSLEGLNELGWNEFAYFVEIHTSVTVKECDTSGKVLDDDEE